MRPSLRDVAGAAGVSLATASRALNGADGRVVPAETRALVQRVASELGYRRMRARGKSSAGVSAATRRAHNLGLVLCEQYRYSDPFWSHVLEGVTAEALRNGCRLHFTYTADDLAHDQQALSAEPVGGLILVGDMGLAADISGAFPTQSLVAIVGSDATRWEADVRHNVVTMEKLAAMDSVVGHLAALGRRRLAYLGPTPDHDRRTEGFIGALIRHGLPVSKDLIVECYFGTDQGYEAANQLLSAHAGQIDGLVCACDTIAFGAVRAAKELGLSLPADLAVAGYDNIPFSRDLDPPLTTVNVPKELMGELAVRRLIECIAHPEWPPIIQTVPTRLVVRSSCGESLSSWERASPVKGRTV